MGPSSAAPAVEIASPRNWLGEPLSPIRVLFPCALVLVVATSLLIAPGIIPERVAAAMARLGGASREWLSAAAICLLAGVTTMGAAWRAAFGGSNGPVTTLDATARHAIGSMVSAVGPAGAGAAARIALFSRTLTGPDRLIRSGGAAAVVAVARFFALGAIALTVLGVGGFLDPVVTFTIAVAGVGAAVVVASRPRSRSARHLLARHAVTHAPNSIHKVLGWTATSVAARIAACACVAAGLGIDHPLRVGLVTIVSFSLAAVLPLVPGNVLGSGAAAIALHSSGLDASTALSAGIAYQVFEGSVNVAVGTVGALALSGCRYQRGRLRISTR
jgi:uncharacterized membrane protein YbhN (UPF0104 family)